MSSASPTESAIQRDILDYLVKFQIFHFRNNSGMAKKGKRWVRFGVTGGPDIICVVRGQFIGLEVKGPDGKQSEAQLDFAIGLGLAGGRYILVRSLDDVIELFEMMRK